MSRRRRVAKERLLGLSDVVKAILCDDPLPEKTRENEIELFVHEYYRRSGELQCPTIEDYWCDHEATILERWTALYPGSRPSCWWDFSSPRWERQSDLGEPRQRAGAGGGGQADHEMAIAATWRFSRTHFRYGISTRWAHHPIPPDNPALFESEPAYLRRYGLLTPAEAKRLHPADFDPEPYPEP